jgi:non-specific serine/threonine protein kinase
MLETIREYALERLVEANEADAVRRRHAGYFLRLAEGLAPPGWGRGQPGQAARLAEELENLRAALEWSVAGGSPHEAVRLAAALGWFWHVRMQVREGRRWLKRALDRARDADVAEAVLVRVRSWSGKPALADGDYGAAVGWLGEALAALRRQGDADGIAHTLYTLGYAAEYQGDDRTAVARYHEALTLARRSADQHLVGHLLSNLADAAYRAGDPALALALDEESVAVLRAVGDVWGVVLALTGVAQAACALGDLPRTLAFLREAVELAAELDYAIGFANALAGFAAAALALDLPNAAARLLGATAALQERAESPVLPHHAQHQRAIAAARAALGERAYAEAFAGGRALSLDEAIAEAMALEPPPPALARLPLKPAAVRAGLTPREVEILRLLVGRRTDQEMAAALAISTRTVATHVARIREKLGVHSRREAAEVAVRDGLV